MIQNYANKVMDYEYNAFMTAMNVSVSKHLMDQHFTVLWANDFFYDLIGYEKEEYEALYSNRVDEYYKDDPDSYAFMGKIVLSAFQQKEPGYEFECPMHTKSGKTTWIRVTGRFTDEVFEGIPVIYTIYTDITKLKEMQQLLERQSEQLAAALEEAEKANQAKSDFLSRMSHDIRTPMNAIMGMTSIAESHLDNPDRVKDCLGKITVSSKLLLSLINEVLDMSKIESGRMVLAEEEVNLADLVHGVVTMVQSQIGEKQLKFNTHINDISHEHLVGDMQRLQQLLLNLLSNAVKYTPEGGNILLEIHENSSVEPGVAQYQFIVTDSGIGMKPEFLERIFEPFERADDERIRTIQGTGLGLSICKSMAQQMGGGIQVVSEYGKGSRFTASVQLRVEEVSIDECALRGLSILLVDDDEIICRNTCERLEELGMRAEWAMEGIAAVEKVSAAHAAGQDYFAVIVDLKMPGMDGMETTRRIREKAGPDLPIIMISAYDLSDQIDAATHAGANGFITKPLFRSRLVYKLKQFLEDGVQQEIPSQAVLKFHNDKRILLVEDNKLNREIAVELLSQTGAAIETAANGKEALEQVSRSAQGYYDLIFMDIQMPIMDGCTAAEKIRALSREDTKTLPIIAMTANAFADDREKTASAGMNEHLAKPIELPQLYRVLNRWLQDETGE